jgi:hypothetical protein|tara:strand:+ start:331 stop:495 length:165 start_codon:yes stop_codon:yes gene_type:complete
MDRVQKKVIQYTQKKYEDSKQMNMFKMLRNEVNINGTGTHKYRIKKGPNKNKVV